jgi:hypothetical protein
MNQKGIRKVYVQLGALPIKKFYEKALWEGSVEKLCGKALWKSNPQGFFCSAIFCLELLSAAVMTRWSRQSAAQNVLRKISWIKKNKCSCLRLYFSGCLCYNF